MSVLMFVRHGQASFLADDYDRLSTLGENQCRMLGRYWARLGLKIDVVYTGPRIRQRASADLVGTELRDAGFEWPMPVVDEDLDEYDLEGLLNHLSPRLAKFDPHFAALLKVFQQSEGETNRVRSFQPMFEALLSYWQTIGLSQSEVESWPYFRDRVHRVIKRIRDGSDRGKRIAVLSSGGVIACAVQFALGISDQTTLELNWRIRNSAITEFVFSAGRFSLDSFNTLPHLDNTNLWSYR